MAGWSITKLPRPPKGFRPGKGKHRKFGGAGFETKEDAEREDDKRARLIRTAKGKLVTKSAKHEAKMLASRLEDRRQPPASLASQRYMRKHRARVAGWLWWLHCNPDLPQCAFFTILPDRWRIAAEDLALIDPNALLEGLRADINRVLPKGIGGYLFACLHGEFVESVTGGYFDIHVHGLACGRFVAAIDSLRHRPKYHPKSWSKPGDRAKFPRVRVSRGPLTNLPKPMTYCVQAFWPAKAMTKRGSIKTQRGQRRRIPEPFHTQLLIWLDRWKLQDITLLMGIRATKKGLQPGKKSYTNESDDSDNLMLE